jgi:hypothetical protein
MMPTRARALSGAAWSALALALLLLSPLAAHNARAESFCVPGPGDRPETTIQGGLKQSEIDVPGGFQGQWCGMHLVGYHALPDSVTGKPRGSFGDVQYFGHCAYASMRDPSNTDRLSTGVAVLDMRVPSNPILVQTLRTPAMIRAYSAFEIQQNTMIAAFKDFGPDGNNWFDVYHLSLEDCLHPTFVATTTTAGGNHDGWLTPDTKTYYGIPFGGVRVLTGTQDAPVYNNARIDMHVLDLSDPTQPKRLMTWNRLSLPQEIWPRVLATTNFHDVSTNEDGTRVYMALYGGNNSLGGNNNNPIPRQNQRCSNGLLTLDSSQVATRTPGPNGYELKYVSFVSWCDPAEPGQTYHYFDPDFGDGSTASAHATEYVVHENGMHYIVTTDESSAGLNGDAKTICLQRSFGRLIDITDEQHPRVVSTFKPDIGKPANCVRIAAEQINGGMIHYIGFDDRYKMRLVVYAGANYGMRVVDYRDPEHPKEIAYYKAPSVETTGAGENDFTRPDPRMDNDACLIYTGWNQGGLRVLELTNPEYNACMRRATSGGGWLAGSGKNSKTNFSFDAARADGGRGALGGSFELNDRDANAKISIDTLSYLGSVHDGCGAILPTANAVQFNGSGSYNGAPASFRVCVEDSGHGGKAKANKLYVTCTAGCAYTREGEPAGGDLAVVQRP